MGADLSQPVKSVKGVGPKKAEALHKLGIDCMEDVLFHYPRSYEDMRNPARISELKDGDKAMVCAKVLLISFGRGFGRKRTLRLLTEDESGRMEVLFFQAGFMSKAFRQGESYCFFGSVKNENGRITMFHPVFSPAEDAENAILPVYPLSRGISMKEMRKLTREALAASEDMEDSLPPSVRDASNVCGIHYPLSNIHYPEDEEHFAEARYRLVYEEFFDLRTALLLSKSRFGSGRKGIPVSSGGAAEFIHGLPFEMTGAQLRAIDDILSDMASDTAMNRLVQGDVGSGKTAVAEAAMMETVKAGLQCAFMAPTEILAAQHFESLTRDLGPYGVGVELITGSMGKKARAQALQRLEEGVSSVAVGTHALISDDVIFRELALVITDEQHRFGVNHRKQLSAKGRDPHVLVMTATPIPRTLAVVLYGDLDISVIDELPPGRKPIKTLSLREDEREDAYRLLTEQVRLGRQAYVVAPFIEDSEVLDARSAVSVYEEFRKKHTDISCGLLHGAMKQSEKDEVMEDFAKGRISVLIATVVIEVGINVPNATVMLIENSERFGLAQLHQLRGRVGRGSDESWCLLLLGDETPIAKERAKTMCSSSSGFEIADKDLQMRGPGELFGYRQHGLPQLRLADPIKHIRLAEQAGADAQRLLSDDPSLEKPENAALRLKIEQMFTNPGNITL